MKCLVKRMGFPVTEQTPAFAQRGLGLVTAIFVITVAALLVVGMASLLVSNQQSYAHALLSTRAQLAADSGLELGLQALRPVSGATVCEARSTPVLPDQSFASCRLTLHCQALQTATGQAFVISAKARCGSGADTTVSLAQRVLRP